MQQVHVLALLALLAAGVAVVALGGVGVPAPPPVPAAVSVRASGSAVSAEAPVDQGEPSLPGVPTAAQQTRLEAARARTARPTLDDVKRALQGEAPPPPAPEVFRPAVASPVGVKPGYRPPDPASGDPLPPDVRGLQALLEHRREAVNVCMKWNAPPQEPGEDRVTLEATIRKNSETTAAIDELAIRGDAEGRYGAFLTCLHTALREATFSAPHHGDADEVVSWALWR